MSRPVIAVYPGTFDPLTLGHEDIVRRAAQLFDRVVIAVATAHHKKTLFDLDERLALTREALADLPQVRAEPFTGLVTVFAAAQGASAMVRGVRGVTDFDYEAQLAGMNRALRPEIDTVFLTPSAATQHISSTLVREISMLDGDVAGFVSAPVLAALERKRAERRPS